MPPHDDHNRPGHPRAHGPHPPPRGPGHHPPHFAGDLETTDGLYRQICELKAMGAADPDLHDLIDSEAERLNCRLATGTAAAKDPGRGTAEEPVGAVERARTIFRNARTAEDDWMTDSVGKDVLVIAEFRPHLLDRMMRSGIRITQIHPPTPEGDTPPHFYHLARRGFQGLLDLKDLSEANFEMLLFEGYCRGPRIYVAPLVPVTLRMFPEVIVAMLEAEHRAPHMSLSIADKGFARIPGFE